MRVDGLRMIERQAVRHAAATVVADDGEALEAEVLHQLDLVLRHGALGIVAVVLAILAACCCRRSRAGPAR